MSYIGNNPSFKTVTLEGYADFATADASPKRAGRQVYVQDEEAVYLDDGTALNKQGGEQFFGTGLQSGGELTPSNPLPSLVHDIDVAAGKGTHVDLSDPANPVYTEVEWGAQTLTITGVAAQEITYVTIDSTGTLQQQASTISPADSRNRIYLGIVGHTDNTNLTSVTSLTVPAQAPLNSMYDFARAVGNLKLSGNQVGAFQPGAGPSTDLSIYISGGSMFKLGSNPSDQFNPHTSTQLELIAPSFTHVYEDAGGNLVVGTATTQVDVSQFNNGGTLDTVNNNSWSVFSVFKGPTSNTVLLAYGTQEYNSSNTAIQRFASLESLIEPQGIEELTHIGFIVARGGATDFNAGSEALFIDVGKFSGTSALSSLDVEDIILDTKANLDALTKTAGKIYYATDEGNYYGWDGSAYVGPFGSGGGGATELDDLTDVDMSTTPPANENIMMYDGGNTVWVPTTAQDAVSLTSVGDHSDVDTTTTAPTTGDILEFDGTNFVPVAPSGGGASTLDELSDVDMTTTPPANENIMMYDGGNTAWVPTTAQDAVSLTSVGDHSDVDLTTPPTNGQVLEYNGASFVPATPSGGGGGGVAYLSNGSEVDTGDTMDGNSIYASSYSANFYFTSDQTLTLGTIAIGVGEKFTPVLMNGCMLYRNSGADRTWRIPVLGSVPNAGDTSYIELFYDASAGTVTVRYHRESTSANVYHNSGNLDGRSLITILYTKEV